MAAMRVLVLAVLTVGVLSDSTYNQRLEREQSVQQCAVICPHSDGKFSYNAGQTYEYQYSADIQTYIPGSQDQSNLHLSAAVYIDVISQCELSLRVNNVQLQDSDPSNSDTTQHVDNHQQFKQSIEAKPLRFSFINGKVESICPTQTEEAWVLNIKRGILSTLQNTMTSLQGVTNSEEVDVTGTCPVKYRVIESQGNMLKVKKTKNLLGCTDRSSAQSIFQSVGYKTESDIQSVPILKGTHQCEQEIDAQSKIFKRIECIEKHVFRPFSRENSGATTQIKYRLVFQRNSYGGQIQQGQMGPNRLPLLYDHTLSGAEMQSNLRESQQLITILCRQTQPDVRPEAPGTFSKLVKQMRGLDSRSLRQLQSSSQSSCPKAQQFLRDAIAVLATPASVSIIRDLITNNQVSEIEADILLTSIAFVQNPTDEMMRELKNLLQSDLKRASLPVSSVIYTYITKNNGDPSVIADILKIFENQLKYNCRASGEEDKAAMLLALRAIGNAGGAERLAPTLDRCAANDQAPTSLRVAAITAYRRMSCSASREQMYRLYANKELDSELRINAYLAVIKCADHTVISRIHGQLNDEVVNQVGSFVWTHLTNLAETSSPLKSDISEIITDPQLLKEFDIDKRKFSRNVEFSTFSDYFNLGGSVESNIILSSQSYVPRSASLNLTVDLFGQSVNLVDVGVRSQGLESILEKYFGPGSDLGDSIRRDKRQTQRDYMIQNIDRQYSITRDPMELSYYLRIFGNEIKSGDISEFNADGLKNKFDLNSIIASLAQQRSIDYTRSYSFMDSSISIPTGLGMPVKLGVEGTITAGLTANGKIDVRRLLSSPADFDISGSVRPSTAVEIRGEFGVDAHVSQTGLKVVNRLHSSTLVDGKVTLKNGQVFNFDWNMPQEKIEIFSAESHFYITHRGQDREQRSERSPANHNKCTGQDIANSLGWELCGELSYPIQPNGLVAPLNGPSVVKIYLNKKDTFSSAKIEASFIRQQVEKVDTARFSFTTPGSRVDRELTADFRLDRTNKDVSLNIKSPWKKVSVNGQLQSDAELKKAVLTAVVDERQYSATAELRTEPQRDQRENGIKYIPNVRIVWPNRQPITLEGSLTYIRGRRVIGNVAIKNAFSETINVNGSVQMVERQKQNKYDVNVQITSPILRSSVVGYVTSMTGRAQTWASRMDVNYQYRNGPKHRLVFNNKIRDTSTQNLNSYSADGSWSTTMWPQYNGRFEFKKSYSPNSIRTTFDAGFDAVRKIAIVQSGAYDFNGADKKLNAEVKVELPYYRVNYETKVNHVHNWDMLQSNATVKTDENSEHTFDLGFKKDTTRYLNAQAEAKLKLAGRQPMTFTNTLIERAPRQYHNQLKIESPGRSVSAIGLYKMAQRHELNADIQATGYEPISIAAHLNPNPKTVQAKLDVKYGRSNYMADVNWLIRGAPRAFNARAGVEVGYLSKKYGLAGELSRMDHNVSARIQATCGPDKRISASAKISANPRTPELMARVEWPRNHIEVLASVKYQPQDWTRTTDDFEAGLRITTGFQGYDSLGGNLKIDYGVDSLRSNAAVSWGSNKRITGDLTYSRNRVDLNVNTPFYGYRTIKANAQYNKRGNSGDISANAEWESNRMSLSGRMTHERGNGLAVTNHGEATLRSPWQGYREMRLTWRHQNDDGTFWKCHHELEAENNQKYILDIDGNNRRSGNSHDLKLKATFTSPIQDWEHVAFNWDSNHDYQNVRARGVGSATWARKTIRLEHELEVRPSTFIAKAKVSTPFPGYEEMGVDMDNKIEPRTNTYTLKNELLLGRPQKKVGLEGSLVFNGPTFNTGVKITTPLPDYPRIGMSLRNGQQEDGVWALHGDLEFRRGTSFTLDGRLGLGRKYGAELSLTSPFESLRRMTAKAIGSATSAKQWEGDLEVSHNLMRNKVKLSTNVNVETLDNARISALLQTPWQKLDTLRLSATHAYQSRERCVTTLEYEFNQHRGQLNHEQNMRSGGDFDGRTRIEYKQGQVITMDHRVNVPTGDRGTLTATLTSPFNEARNVELTANFNGQADNFRSTFEIVINRRDRINGNAEFSTNPQRGQLKAKAGLTTPFEKLRNFQTSYEQSGTPFDHSGPEWNSDVDVSYQVNNNRWWSKRTLNVNRDGVFKMNVKAGSTSGSSSRSTEFNLEHAPRNGRNGERGWSNSAWFDLDGVRFTGESEYIWRNNQQLNAKIVLQIPPEEYSLMLNHRDVNGQIATELTGKAGRQGTGSLTYNMNPSASNIELTANVQTQYRNYDRFDLSLKHTGPASEFRTIANIQTSVPGYERFKAELSHRGAANNFNCNLRVETPLRALPSLSARLSHTMTPNQLEESLQLEYSGKTVSTSLTFNNDGRIINLRANLQTPYQGLERFAVNFEHSDDRSGTYRTNIRLTTPYAPLPELGLNLELTAPRSQEVRAKIQVSYNSKENTITYSHNSRNSGREATVNLEVTTPYNGYERSTLSYQFRDEGHTGQAKLAINVYNIAFTGESNGNSNDLELKTEIRSTGRNQYRYGANWKHRVTPGTIDLRSEITTSVSGYERFTVTIKHEPSGAYGFKSVGKLETSVQNYDKYGYEVEYSKPNSGSKNFGVTAKITTPVEGYRNFEATLNNEVTPASFKTSGRIITPFSQAPQIDYSINYRGRSWRDFNTGLEIQYSGKKIELESTFKYDEGNGYESDYSGTFKINTPCPYLRELDIRASHNRRSPTKSGSLLVQFNGDKKVDFDYSYTTEGPRNIQVNLRDPYQVGSSVRMADSDRGSAVINWDPNDRSKHIKFDFGFKDIKSTTSTERLLSLKTSIPNSRILGFLVQYKCEPNQFKNKVDLFWDADQAADFSYELEGKKIQGTHMSNYDGKIKINSDFGNFETELMHKSQQNGRYETEISAGSQRNRLTVKSDLNARSDTDYVHTITLQHPRFTQDVSIQTEVRNGNSFKSIFNFDRQSATLEGSYSRESNGRSPSTYNAMIHLLHPNSQTDIKLTGLVYGDSSKIGGSLESQYKTSRDRQIKISLLKAEIDKIKKELSAELQTPVENFKLKTNNRGVGSYSEGVYRYDVMASVGRSEYKYSADLSTKDRSVDIKLYDNLDYIQIFTQFYSPLHSQIDISRSIQGRKHNDVQISLIMNDDRVVKGRAYIRPQILQDLTSYFQNLDRYPPGFVRSLTQSSESLARTIDDEWQLKKRSLEDSMNNFVQVWESAKTEVTQKINEIRTAFNSAYYRNDFYIKDIHEVLKRHYDDLSRQAQYKMAELRRSWYDYAEKARQANKVVVDKFNEISDAMAQKSQEIKYSIDQSIQKTNRYFEGVSADTRQKVMAYIHRMENHPFYRDYALFKPSDFLLPPEQWMDKLKSNYARVIARLEADLDQYVANNRPQIQQLKNKLMRYLQENQEVFRSLGLETKLRDYMYKLQMMTWPQLKEQIKKVLNDYFQVERTKWTAWDPRRGEYSFEVYVPVDLPEFSSVQKVYNLDLLTSPRSYLPDISFPEDWTLMDFVVAYRPATDVTNWVPPFKAHATVIGNQHYMTFDRKFYEFAGECSYLLARDFIGKAFSVIVNYERTGGMPVKKSISVLADGKQMDITTDGRLNIDGRRSEMPYSVGNTTVSREGNTIVVNNDHGLQIICDLPHDHCTVAVSGWYYGKTAGLMGTYDNEQFNDFISTDKRLRNKPEEMAESWTVGARCSPNNYAQVARPEPSSRRYRACAEVFETDSSIMRPCFKKVAPKPFMDMCLNDVPNNDNSLAAQTDICRAAAAYKHECRRQDAHVRMPTACVQCEMPLTREKFYEGETKKFTEATAPKSADVVLVVQHAPCNREVIAKIRESLDTMVRAFSTAGLREVRYALIGFGGSEHLSDAHVQTMDGQIFAESSQVASALNTFSIESGQSSSKADVLGALAYAAKLPFRAGVSKSVILVACDSCQEFSVRYSDVQRVLLQTDIHLHVLVPQPIRLKSRSPKQGLIFGVDDETVYTGKDVADDQLTGEADLRKYILLPKDLCVALTHETEGSVFSSTQWTQSQGNLQKRFTDVFSRMVALKADPADCQQCECVADETGSGLAQCRSCYQRPIFSFLPNFNDGDYSDEISSWSNQFSSRNNKDGDDDQPSRNNRGNNRNNAETPQGRPQQGGQKNRGGASERVPKPRRPTDGQRPPQRIPGRPDIRDQ